MQCYKNYMIDNMNRGDMYNMRYLIERREIGMIWIMIEENRQTWNVLSRWRGYMNMLWMIEISIYVMCPKVTEILVFYDLHDSWRHLDVMFYMDNRYRYKL